MEAAPPVRYVQTSDGMNIAYAVRGRGSPIVFLPFHHNQVERRWIGRLYWIKGLAEHHLVVHYDSRGQGLSTRDLTVDPTPDDYRRDLEAVIDATGFEAFALVAYGGFAHVALAYAIDHPDRIHALVLICACESFKAWPLPAMLPLAEQNWDLFVRLEYSHVQQAWLDFVKVSGSQQDYIRMVRGFANSDVSHLLPRLEFRHYAVSSSASAHVGNHF